MAAGSGNFLLRFIADMSQVERELNALQAKGKAASTKAATTAATTARPGRIAGVDVGALGVTDPASAGRARGSLRSLVRYLDSVGQLGNVVGGKQQLLRNIETRFASFAAQDPAAYKAASTRAQSSTTRALRASGVTDASDAARIAEQQYAAATQQRTQVTQQAAAATKANTAKQTAAQQKLTAATQKNAAAQTSTRRPMYGPPAPPVSQNPAAIAQRQAAQASAKLAAAQLLQTNTAHQAVLSQQDLIAQQQAHAKGIRNAANSLARTQGANAYNAANASQIAAAKQHAGVIRSRVNSAVIARNMDEQALREKAKEVVLQEQYNRALARSVRQEARQQGLRGIGRGGGGFGGGGAGGGFGFAGGARSVIRYGLPAAVLYGAVSGISTLIREATELELELGLLEDQWQSMADTAGEVNGVSFDELRGQILDISKASLTSADQVAGVTRQLSAAFAEQMEAGTFDLEGETQTALQFSKVTGLPVQEITDSVTAIRFAFEDADVTVQEFADTTTYLEQRFGVLSKEIATFVADIAPLGAELGFTYEQLAGVAAVAQQASGRSGAVLSEQLGRILPAIKDRQAELLEILSNSSVATETVNRIAAAFGANDIPGVIMGLAEAYQNLESGQRNAVGALVGTRREAATLFALLSRNEKLGEVLGDNFFAEGAAEGAFEARWERYRETVSATFESLGRSVEKFGLALFDAGLGDLLISLGNLLGGVADALVVLTEAMSDFNQMLGGAPGQIIAMVATLGLLAKAINAVRDAHLAAAAASFLGGKKPNAMMAQVATGAYGGAPTGAPVVAPTGLIGRLGASTASSSIGRIAGLGAGAAGAAFGGIALIGAGMLANAAREQYMDLRNDTQEAASSFQEQVRQAYEDGKTEEEIMAIAEEFSGREGTRAKIGHFVSGSKGIVGEARDALQEVQLEERTAILERILAENEDATVELATAGISTDIGLEEFIQALRDDPTSDKLNDMADVLLEQYPEIAEAVRAARAEAEANEAAASAADRRRENALRVANQNMLSVSEATVEFESGRLSADQFLRVLDMNIASLEEQIAIAEQHGNADISLHEKLEEYIRASNEVRLNIKSVRPLEAERLLATLTGGSELDTAEQNVDIARQALKYANNSEESFDAAVGILEAQQTAFQAYVDAGATAAEKLARAQEGYNLDPEALRVVTAVALQNNEEVIRIADEIGMDIEELTNAMVKAIDNQGNVNRGIIEDLLRQSAAVRIAAIKMSKQSADVIQAEMLFMRGVGPNPHEDTQAAIDAINAQLEAQIEALYQEIVSTTPSGGGSASEQTVADLERDAAEEAERARKEAEDAAKEARDLARRIEEARLDYLLAQVESDPVAAARNAQAKANIAIRYAEDEAERISAEASRIRADRQLEEAMFAIHESRVDLLIAMAEASGNSVEASRLAMEKARAALWRTGATHQGEAAMDQARAALVSAEASYRDAQLQDKMETYEFMHEMGQITTQQLIGYLESLLRIPDLTQEQTRDIQRQIKGLKDDLSANYQFNLPSDLALPTLYEVRRISQTPGGVGGYQDNSMVQINFTAYNTEDANAIADKIVNQFSRPTRFGTASRAF